MTKVSWVRQLGLAATLFVLGLVAYWVEYRQKPMQENREQQDKKVFQIAKTPIKSLALSTGGQVYEFNCLDIATQLCKPGDNAKWELVRPQKLKADDSNTNGLVSALNNLSSTEVIDLHDETAEKRAALLKEYGLDPASRNAPDARKITLSLADGQWVAYFGKTHPIGDGIFVLLEKTPATPSASSAPDDSRVFLIPGFFKSQFEHDLAYWRNKKLLTVAAHDIESFRLESKKAGTIEGLKKDGHWTLQSQSRSLVGDIENIDSLLSGAEFLAAKNFASEAHSDARAQAALKGIPLYLTLTLQKSRGTEKEAPTPIVLKLYAKPQASTSATPKGKPATPAPVGKIFATVSNLDPLFELDSTSRDRIDKGLNDLRLMKLITSIERFSAKKLSFSGKGFGATPVQLVNLNGKWVFEKNQSEANGERILSLLEKLSGNRIKETVPPSAQGKISNTEAEGVEITLGDEKDAVKRHLRFWKSGNQLYARDLLSGDSAHHGEVFLVDSSVRDGLPWSADELNQPKPEASKTPGPKGKS